MSTPELSVVMPVFNGAATLDEQLGALLRSAGDRAIEIVPIDNASTDASAEILAAWAAKDPRVRPGFEPRQGAPHALNTGIGIASASLLAFCDADDIVGEQWIDAAIGGLDGHDIVTGPLELERLNPSASSASRGTSWARRVEPFAGIFPLVPSGNFAATAAALDRIGSFDPNVAIGYDVDFAYRAFQAGIDVNFEPDLEIHYRYREDARGQWRQGRAMGRVQPVIERRLRADGHSVSTCWATTKRWLWLLRKLPTCVTVAGRRRWLWVAAMSVGRLEGTIRARGMS